MIWPLQGFMFIILPQFAGSWPLIQNLESVSQSQLFPFIWCLTYNQLIAVPCYSWLGTEAGTWRDCAAGKLSELTHDITHDTHDIKVLRENIGLARGEASRVGDFEIGRLASVNASKIIFF